MFCKHKIFAGKMWSFFKIFIVFFWGGVKKDELIIKNMTIMIGNKM